jgi:hypothetical protein
MLSINKNHEVVDCPKFVPSDKGDKNFTDRFGQTMRKIEFSQNRVKMVSTPFTVSKTFRDKYKDIFGHD